MSKMIERIEREAGIPGLLDALTERLQPTDLQSLLIEVARRRAQQRPTAALLADYENDSLVRPSTNNPRRLLEWTQTAYAQLPPDFVPVALSPVAPLGAASIPALVDQNRVLSTTRNNEVLSDSTNVLALEASLRRRRLLKANPKSAESVHLATSHRLLRTQQFPGPNSFSHFEAFALCSAGRDTGNLRFELSTLVTHMLFYLRLLDAFLGPEVGLKLAVTDFNANDRTTLLEQQVFAPIRDAMPRVECTFDDARSSGRNYYVDLCFHIYAVGPEHPYEVADGGVVDWTQTLLNNRKERCVTSGIGSERVCSLWP
jgi:hypothetical protein